MTLTPIQILTKILAFMKKYWKEIFIAICVASLFFKMRGDYSSLVSVFESATKSHEEQLAKVKKLHENELLARNEIIEKYSKRLTELELEHSEDKEALLEEFEKRKRAYVIAFGENGEGLKKDIENYFGIEYVSPE